MRQLPSPPVDQITLATTGEVRRKFLHTLTPCERFDEGYTLLLQSKPAEDQDDNTDEDEEGTVENFPESDTDNDYEYDDDIYYDDGYDAY